MLRGLYFIGEGLQSNHSVAKRVMSGNLGPVDFLWAR